MNPIVFIFLLSLSACSSQRFQRSRRLKAGLIVAGFGAGCGSLLYVASYYDPAGNILARL